MENYCPTRLIVNKECIIHNINEIKKIVGENVDIMPVVKAYGYGTGIVEFLDIFKELNISKVAVANVNEAIELRFNRFDGTIVVLSEPCIEEVDNILKYNITPNVCYLEFIKKLSEQASLVNKIANIHIEIDTGMGRTGVAIKNVNDFFDELKQIENIKITGIFTHFSSSSLDFNYTKKQIEKFNNVLAIAESKIGKIEYIHACNSGGIMNFKEAHYNLVRPGLIIYGHYPNNIKIDNLNLKPATKLVTKITYINDVEKGEAIGYDKVKIVENKTKIGIIPIGYADIRRGLEDNKGYVGIKGEKVKIIAACMDVMIIDITTIKDVKIGDEVIIWDNELITVEECGVVCNTSNYEMLSALTSRRIQRVIE